MELAGQNSTRAPKPRVIHSWILISSCRRPDPPCQIHLSPPKTRGFESPSTRIIFGRSAITCANAPGKGAQLVGRRLNGVDARKRRYLGLLCLGAGNERADRTFDRRQCGRIEGHLDLQVRPKSGDCVEDVGICEVGGEEPARLAHRTDGTEIGNREGFEHPLAKLASPSANWEGFSAWDIAILKSASSEDLLIRLQPTESEVPPEKTECAPS